MAGRFTVLMLCLLAACLSAWPAVAAVATAPSAAPAGGNAACLDCHEDSTLKDAHGGSLTVHAATFEHSAHHGLACAACHTDALSVRHPRQPLGIVSITTCAACHQEQINQLTASVHGLGGAGPKLCTSCHGDIHAVLRPQEVNGWTAAVAQIQSCGHCHESMMSAYLSSAHAHALLVAGLAGAPSCTDCHGAAHEIQPAANPHAATSFAQSPQTCGTCHAGILAQWRESTHGMLWQQGRKGGPVCTTCHEAHAVKTPTSAVMRRAFPSECGTCHSRRFQSFEDSFHGQASSLGSTRAATCTSCHTAHHNLPPNDPRSSVNPVNLRTTCGKCHDGEVNAAFLTFDPHADPRDPNRNLYLYWVWVLMTALLLGVFGFFGLHDLLWLQRTVVGKLRGEYPRSDHPTGPYVRRFTSTQIVVHVVVIVSFLVLAATGLPLKYAGAPWAPKLMALWGGPHAAGIVHRIAAVVTFGYFGFHVLAVLYRMALKHEKGYLWGARSLVPQPSDIRDLVRNVGYFLYLRAAPKFDRWTYWEKFDYLAVFWGVAIIGFTGLMLWFPGFFTRFLPGWTLNAAFIAHSDEALLATGFIFVFHFFHTHLRPEAFPMDPVIFTGRMPLERLKEERPLQYARLAATGALEQLLVPPPTRAQLVRAYVFGLAMVAIGVALAIGIFVALLRG
jgi:cytochrome b subunit of formate dehydrogenase